MYIVTTELAEVLIIRFRYWSECKDAEMMILVFSDVL
jgi:hypothetical protein